MSEKRNLKVDFHVHSCFSFDGEMSPEEILDLARKFGLDAIAVTDHGSIEGGKETEKIAKDVVVLPGSEIKTKEGEIIGLNLKKDVPPNLSLLKTCRLIRGQGGFVVVPHPFDMMRKGVGKKIGKITDYIDAVEVFNSRTLIDRFNKNASKFAEEHKLPKVAGSDAHSSGEFGSAYTLVYSRKSKDEILKAVKRGKTRICGKKSGVHPHVRTFLAKIGKKF